MPTPIIIDTDPGVDDIVAILYALASPELEILAFIVSFGNTDIDASYNNIFKLYETLSRHFDRYPEDRNRFPNFTSRPFIARGPAGPLEGDLHSAQYFHGRDGLGDITSRHPEILSSTTHPQLRISEKPGHELALELIKDRPARTVTYAALGPLTNLALMAREDPSTCRDLLGRVVSMGGALDVPGNTSPVAEFNFFADPYAVKELLVDTPSVIPLSRIFLCPLDVTTPHELSFPFYKHHVDATFENASTHPSKPDDEGKSELVHFTSSFLERTREVMLEFGKDAMELHDVVAIWCAAENPPSPDKLNRGHLPESLPETEDLQEGWQARRRLFHVERTGELTRGMLVVDRRDESTIYIPGDNRAQVAKTQAALEKAVHDLPAPVQVENPHISLPSVSEGVPCIVATPGCDILINKLLFRIWGVAL